VSDLLDPAPAPSWATPIVQPLPLAKFMDADCPSPFGHHVELNCVVNRRGHKMVSAKCSQCGLFTTYIKHAELNSVLGVHIDDVGITTDNRCGSCSGDGCNICCEQCERCRRFRPTHRHHTAPSALFPDANLWPVVDLCEECHTHWHRVMTPGMRRKPTPVANHLRPEWDDYHNAKAKRQALDHHYGCECPKCALLEHTINNFHERYGWTA
jgi:hypothetical protein